MDTDTQTEVARHYTRAGLEEAILAALRQVGLDPDRIAPADLAPVDEFHLGWRPATAELATALGLGPDTRVLDIGAGLGGPARYFADTCGSRVVGIDLTPDFVATATALTRRTGLADRVGFREASALALPFSQGSFDAATLIHVGMNVADKARLFAEARRVLRPGGRFGLFEVMRTGDGEIPMPMPWASTAATSFVETPERYRALLADAGFRPVSERDRTAFVLDLVAKLRAKTEAEGHPVLGLHLLIGPEARDRVGSLVGCVESGLLAPVEMIAEAA
jgi:ubiquinone/menaquinone biosynthesis C-methylase UbiE